MQGNEAGHWPLPLVIVAAVVVGLCVLIVFLPSAPATGPVIPLT